MKITAVELLDTKGMKCFKDSGVDEIQPFPQENRSNDTNYVVWYQNKHYESKLLEINTILGRRDLLIKLN